MSSAEYLLSNVPSKSTHGNGHKDHGQECVQTMLLFSFATCFNSKWMDSNIKNETLITSL